MDNVGIWIFCIYVLSSYIANDVIVPSALNTLALYAFLAYSAVYTVTKWRVRISQTTVWFGVFLLVSLGTMLYSPEKQILGGSFYLLIVAFILVTCLSQYQINRRRIETILWTYAMASPVMLLILSATGNLIIKTGDAEEALRLGEELLGNANILALMIMLSVLYALWLLIYSKNGWIKKILLMASVAVNYYGMFLSGGRKYIIVPILFLYVLLLFKQDKKGRTHLLRSTAIVVIAAVGVYLLIMNVPTFYEMIGSRMESLFSFLEGDDKSALGSDKVRSEMIRIGLEKWKSSPLWGYGFDSFKYFNREATGHFYYSHNNFVEMLYNGGVIGFIAYYWIYAKGLISALRSRGKASQGARAFIIAMVLSMLFYEYGAINYTSTGTIIMFYIAEQMMQINAENAN